MESYFNRCARVAASVRSFTATSSRSVTPSRWAARTTFRPIRPNPLIAMRVVILIPVLRVESEGQRGHVVIERAPRPGKGHRIHLLGSGGQQGGRGADQRGPGGEDVVHQNQASTRSPPAGPEGAVGVGPPGIRVESGLTGGLAGPLQQVEPNPASGLSGNRRGQVIALIITALPAPSPSERDRNQDRASGQLGER